MHVYTSYQHNPSIKFPKLRLSNKVSSFLDYFSNQDPKHAISRKQIQMLKYKYLHFETIHRRKEAEQPLVVAEKYLLEKK